MVKRKGGASWRNKRIKKQRGNNNNNNNEGETKSGVKKQYRKMGSVTGDGTKKRERRRRRHCVVGSYRLLKPGLWLVERI